MKSFLKKDNIEELLSRYRGASLSRDDREALKVRILRLAEAQRRGEKKTGADVNGFRLRRIAVPATAVIILFALASGTVVASDRAKPGDLLFPVDKAIENVRLALVRSPLKRAKISLAIASERSEELKELSAFALQKQSARSHFVKSLSIAVSETDHALQNASHAVEEAEADIKREGGAAASPAVYTLRKELVMRAAENAKQLRVFESSVREKDLKSKASEAAESSQSIAEHLIGPKKEEEAQPLSVAILELRQHPEKYSGALIRIRGIVIPEDNVHELSDAIVARDGGYALAEPIIWVTGMPGASDLRECAERAFPKKGARFCWWEVAGRFAYGGTYGPHGRYTFQLKGGYMIVSPPVQPSSQPSLQKEKIPFLPKDGERGFQSASERRVPYGRSLGG